MTNGRERKKITNSQICFLVFWLFPYDFWLDIGSLFREMEACKKFRRKKGKSLFGGGVDNS